MIKSCNFSIEGDGTCVTLTCRQVARPFSLTWMEKENEKEGRWERHTSLFESVLFRICYACFMLCIYIHSQPLGICLMQRRMPSEDEEED
jgi:hypothetical protein